MARKKKKQLEEYEENTENVEIKEDYKHQKRIKFAINLVFIILIVLMILISIDVICVAKYEKGPYFAIKVNQYKDGGTTEYYGLGYKVIKYHQIQGRRDMELGFWTMPYSVEPTETTALDLAIEFQNDPVEAYQRLYKSFLRISGTYSKTNENGDLVVTYNDPDNSYTLNIICQMAEDSTIPALNENDSIVVLGTLKTFDYKTDTTPNTIHMSDCFADIKQAS